MHTGLRRILTIDDDNNVRANIAAYLEDSGYVVLEAENGALGLEAFASGKPDLILVDLWMPVMGGGEFLRHIRELAPKIPVIVVSGIGVLEDAVETLRQGAWDYVTKPITDMRVLEHTIAKCFERADLLEERERYQERLEREVRERTRKLEESIEALKEQEARIIHQVTHDELTKLPNRLGVRDYVVDLIRKSKDKDGFSLFWIDIDDFKTVNDSLGHTIGDMLLCETGQRILAAAGENAVVGRTGGDEFAVLSPIYTSGEAALNFGLALRRVFAEPFFVVGHEVYLQANIGYCLYPEDASDADILINNADLAMYRARDQGIRLGRFDAAMVLEAARRRDLGKMLRKALENNEFVLEYQPKVRVAGNVIAGMEALVRWCTPSGAVLPGEFIPVAEDTGLIVNLGEWVLREACLAQRRLAARGLESLVMSVNISARQFQANLPAQVAHILSETGLPPSLLELEITESSMMRDPEASAAVLRRLKEQGVRIAIDDFGTGHSSLFYLKNFPVDTLKIDKIFVQDVCEDRNDAVLVSSIISMAKALGLDIVAEGVETEEQMRFLRDAGCTQVQGHYFRHALPEEEFHAFAVACRCE